MSEKEVLGILSIITLALFVGCWGGSCLSDNCYRQHAIQRNCARYNPVNGSFEWLEPTTTTQAKGGEHGE